MSQEWFYRFNRQANFGDILNVTSITNNQNFYGDSVTSIFDYDLHLVPWHVLGINCVKISKD